MKRKSKPQTAKRYRVNNKAQAQRPDEKVPATKHPDDVVFAELRSETTANFRRTWAQARTKVCRRYLREVLNWEGGKPVSNAD